MKNTVRVLLFAIIIGFFIYIIQNFTGSISSEWMITATTVLFTFSIIFIGFVIFLENRKPSQTITWLVVLGSFPLIGFLFYLVFRSNVRKKKLFDRKALVDEKIMFEIEGNQSTYEDRIDLMGDHQQMLFNLAHRLGHTPISFATRTKALTNGNETFGHIFGEMGKRPSIIFTLNII